MTIFNESSNNTSVEETSSLRLNHSLAVSMGIFVSILAAATLVCNIVLIIAVLRTTYLHTKTNALLVSVAVSEVILGMFVMPSTAAVLYQQRLQFSNKFCVFVGFMTSLSRSAKSLGILSVSLDRCIAISHPLQYSSFITNKTTTMLITCVWAISLFFAILPLANVGAYGFIAYHGRCMLDFEMSPVFAMVKELVCSVIPSVAIFVTLLIILAEARSHHRITMIAQLAITMYSGAAAVSGVNYARSTFRAMRTFLIITIIYLFTCFPRSLYIVIISGNKTKSNATFLLVSFLTYICSISTPLVITTLNIKFRQSIKTLMEPRNKIRPTDCEPYTISTGLQSVLEASMVFKYVTHKDSFSVLKRNKSNEEIPGPSKIIPSVRFQTRRVSVLNEMQSSSSGDLNSGSVKIGHAPLRKTLSSPC